MIGQPNAATTRPNACIVRVASCSLARSLSLFHSHTPDQKPRGSAYSPNGIPSTSSASPLQLSACSSAYFTRS